MKKLLPLLLISLLLIVAIGFQVFGEAGKRKDMIAPDVGDLIPKEIPGWTIEDRPIAESPDLQKTVEKVLNYDSAVFRFYRKGDIEIAVYLAYWRPGKIDAALLSHHTPDICWVDNGWSKTVLPSLPSRMVDGISVPMPDYRRFTAPGQDLMVLFWQINGHQIEDLVGLDEAWLSPWGRIVNRGHRIWDSITTPPGQQLFLRISSNHSLAQELDTPPAQACLELLSRSLSGKNFYTIKD